MDIKYYIGYLLKSNHGPVKKLIEDITDQESLLRLGEKTNHIRWITGHIASSAGAMARILGGDPKTPPEWPNTFGGGNPFLEDSTKYPSMNELKECLDKNYAEMYRALQEVSMEELETEREIFPGWKATPADAILFLCTHEFYHAGQIALIRSHLGRESLFG